jgi:type II secretion system protein H
MQAHFYRPKSKAVTPRRHSGRMHGFTLLELLVVVVIVAILFTYTTLAIRSDSPEEIIKKEAQRMERLVQLALEESILRGEEYGIEIFIDGYRFLRYNENQWQAISGDKILRQRELPLDMEIEVRLEDTEIVIDPASDALSEQKLNLNAGAELGADNEDEDRKKTKPQIYLLSSGEITPEFDMRFYIPGIETSYLVRGFFDGSLKTEISDL